MELDKQPALSGGLAAWKEKSFVINFSHCNENDAAKTLLLKHYVPKIIVYLLYLTIHGDKNNLHRKGGLNYYLQKIKNNKQHGLLSVIIMDYCFNWFSSEIHSCTRVTAWLMAAPPPNAAATPAASSISSSEAPWSRQPFVW